MRSLAGSGLPSGGGGGGGGRVGVTGAEMGVSGAFELILPPRPRTFMRSGPFCCPACCNIVLIPASCRLPPRCALSTADAGPVGAESPFGPDDMGVFDCDPFGPEGGPAVTTADIGGLERPLLCWLAGVTGWGSLNALNLSGWIPVEAGAAGVVGCDCCGDCTVWGPRCFRRSG